MAMNVKDLRTDSALGARINDGSTKYAQSGNLLQRKSSKPFQDTGNNSLGKVDVQTSRPCAVIGPDRVLPSPNCNDGFVKKSSESWPCPESIYHQPPDYPQKMSEYQPTRNISPRQTFQENMQRIMVTPYSSMKKSDDPNFHVDRNITMFKNVKLNLPPEAKYCEVPYSINPMCNEQKNVRIAEIPGSNVNPVVTRSPAHGWIPNNINIRPLKSYGASELYQFPDYSNCAGPRPMPVIRPHRTIHEDPGRTYPEQFYQDANVRFRPYPPTKGRYPHSRYDYINNYSNTFHPPPPFPNHTFDPQKTAHSYPLYPQVPLKYIDRRMGEPIIDGYQRASPQSNLNIAYRNSIIHPTYGPLQANNMQNNMIPYPSESSSKTVIGNKLPYYNNSNIYRDYELSQHKKNNISETVYSNNLSHINSLKGEVICPNYSSVNMHGMPQYPLYRKENGPIKNYEYLSHFRNIDQSVNFHNPLLRHPIHFSPNAIAISPSDSNTSNDTTQTHTNQEDCGYVSQSSTTSGRSVDMHINGYPNEQHTYKSPEYRNGHAPRNIATQIPNTNKSSKTKKILDVRQFLQMWNEGDDDANEQSKDEGIPKDSTDLNNLSSQYEGANKQEQLYVLGLVNVPNEELDKYNHIQKISKLPENIKGYNNIELLNQFEEAIESSNIRMFNLKPQRELNTQTKNIIPKNQINVSPRPVSPLDVEAKISQSVIHKEVGCNFEIKPCSPKMLSVEIATPIQNILDERIIEKVSNPIASKPAKSQKLEKNKFERSTLNNLQNTHCEKIPKATTVETSCKLDNIQYTNENSINSLKQNYSLQDLEYNSSVCLASLPRLDNDMELNFPEINQQFINANNIETVIMPSPVKDLPILNTDQIDGSTSEDKSAQICDKEHVTLNAENDKEITKLSKYRKLKRTDVDQKESQSVALTKIQLRTDSVIIKNPDTMKNHEMAPNSSINKSINKILDLHSEENNVNAKRLAKETSAVVEFSEDIKNEIKEKNNESIEEENLDVPIDTALDFSLNKSDVELVKITSLKENTGNDSLVNLIEKDLIPTTYDKTKLLVLPTNTSDIKDCLLFNGDKINSDTSGHEQEFVKSVMVNTVSEFYLDEIKKNKNDCDTILSQKELFFNADNTNISNTSASCNSVPDIMKMENLFLHEVKKNMNFSSDKISVNSSKNEDSEIIKKDQNINTNFQIYMENVVTNVDLLETKTSRSDIFDEIQNKQLDDELISSEQTSHIDDIKYANNYATENTEFTLRQSISQNVDENNSTLVDIQKTSKDSYDIDKNVINIKDYEVSMTPKYCNFKKRMRSRIIQNLVLLTDTCVWLNKRISFNNEGKSISMHSNLTCIQDNIYSVKPETVLAEPVKINTNDILNIDVVSPDNTLVLKNHDNLLEIENTNSDTSEISDNVNDVQILKSMGNNFLDNEALPRQVDSEPSDYLISCNEENNAATNMHLFSLSNKNADRRDRNLKSIYIDFNTNDERDFKNEVGNFFLNKTEQLHNNSRAYLKRSFSDSALNIHSNEDHHILNSKNIHTIPMKRKKINPCELMEPNQISENFNVLQTNRRNSISTVYDEENVSFCILVDNSCVLSEENVESQKICLAEITEDAFEEEFENECTFTTGKVMFTDSVPNIATSLESEKLNSPDVELDNHFANNYTVDNRTENKTFGEESWIEDVACIETVFSDNIVEDVVLNPSSSPNEFNVLENYDDFKNDSLVYNDSDNIEKIKYIYGDEMCVDDAELVETLYKTPQMDVRRTLIHRESHYLDDSSRYYDNDALEKILSESNDTEELLSNAQCYNQKEKFSCLNTLNPLKEQSYNTNLKSELLSESTDKCKNKYAETDSYESFCKSTENISYEPTQYDIVYSCQSTCNYTDPYKYKSESPNYSSSSSPEVSSTTSEEKSCGILLKITNCNGSISSQINEFTKKSAHKNDHNLSESKEIVSNFNSLSRKRPLITKAAQKYIPPLKETIHDLKVKLPLPQHSLNKLKILKISKDKPKSDKSLNKTICPKSRCPKKSKPKFEDVLKSIDEIQIQMHKEKNKKHKQSIPKVVIKKNENGAHYTSTSNNNDNFNPDLTGRKWQPWVFIEKNCFIDKMALGNKMKAIFSHRKNTYVLAEKFRKYKSVNNARFVITKPKLEDSSSGKLKYTIRLKHNY